MHPLSTLISPLKVLVVVLFPLVLVFIMTVAVSAVISILTQCTFMDVSCSPVMWLINLVMYIVFAIATGEWLYPAEKKKLPF